MQFKVDENIHTEVADLLRQDGHDASTVYDEGLQGRPDPEVAAACQRESRALVTLDLDFADIRAHPPTQYSGLIVLRLTDQSRPSVMKAMQRVLSSLPNDPLVGHLWIVDDSHIRVR